MKRKDEARSKLSQSAGGGAPRREGSLASRAFGEGSVKPVLDPGLKSLGESQGLFWSGPQISLPTYSSLAPLEHTAVLIRLFPAGSPGCPGSAHAVTSA